MNLISPNARYVALLSYEDGIILRSFVLTQYRRVTDGQKCQGRIKVRGGPRLDTVTGPYPFSSLINLSSTTHTEFLGITPGKF